MSGRSTMRYAPKRPLPPYAFVPGRGLPHPVRDPGGHSFGKDGRTPPLVPERWREDGVYLYGVDLFNAGYPWEAHEAWEGLWVACRDKTQRQFLQGLIQCAAACVKILGGAPDAARRLAARGRDRLEATGRDPYMGLHAPALAAAMERWLAAPVPDFDARPRLELTEAGELRSL